MMMKNVIEMAEKFNNDVDALRTEAKRIQSVKCRLKKQKARIDYDELMTKVLQEEQLVKEAKDYLEPKSTPVTMMTLEDIKILNYDETVKAIKSIQSKKCNTQFLTVDVNENQEYQDACKIEEMLKQHRSTMKPIEDTVVKKSTIQTLINNFKNVQSELTVDMILKSLQDLTEIEDV